jgi:hypothetical protein
MAFSGSFEQFGAKAPWEKNLVSGHYRGGASERKKSSLQGWINEQTETFFYANKRVHSMSDQVRSG